MVAVGPTFAFPIVGAMGGQEQQHSNFATRVSARIADRMVVRWPYSRASGASC